MPLPYGMVPLEALHSSRTASGLGTWCEGYRRKQVGTDGCCAQETGLRLEPKNSFAGDHYTWSKW